MNIVKQIMCLSIMIVLGLKSNAQTTQAQDKVNITNITTNEKADKLYINWSTDGTMATNYFKVQSSEDGQTFKTVAFVLGHNARPAGDNYQYAIKSGSINTLYYKIKYVAANGEEQDTKIIAL